MVPFRIAAGLCSWSEKIKMDDMGATEPPFDISSKLHKEYNGTNFFHRIGA